MNPEPVQAPPISAPANEMHAQNMWVLGVMNERLNSIDKNMERMVQEDLRRNGRIDKMEVEVNTLKNWQSSRDGESKGISMTWYVLSIVAGILIGAATIYFTRH